MNKYKVCVYSICKNEEQFVDRWVDSMSEADKIVVCDTGSSDSTVGKLKSRDVTVYSIIVDPWRFDVARNISMDFIPLDFDICVCTDLDEVLEPGWREKLENVWTPETTRLRYMYTWKFNEDGSRGVTYWYEKIHGRRGYRWVNPVHETLKYFGETQEAYAHEPAIQLNHLPDPAKSRGQYLPLLELSKKENPSDSSTVFWLGREYMFYGRHDKCIETLKEHISLPSSAWDQERCAAMRYIGKSYKAKGDLSETRKWLFRAIAECPLTREPYVDMASLGYDLKEWPLVYYMVEEALKINVKPISYLTEDSSWNHTVYDLGAIACYRIGLYEKSYKYAQIALSLSPHDERLRNNIELIKEKVKGENIHKLKVIVYSVCKNEEKFVDRWMDSMSEADCIIVTDTGSTDNTVEKLRERGAIVYIDVIKPWRFDKARNSCLEKIPEDIDICVSTDLDEVFEPGWRNNLEKAWVAGTTRARYHYTWSFNPDGTAGVTFLYDRIHSRKGFEWVNPAHECLNYTGDGAEKMVWCPDVRLMHFPDKNKDRSFYLPLLELAVAERPEDPRNYHYLGREYMYAGMWDKCIEALKNHLALPNSTWKEERSASLRFIARACKAQNNFIEAKGWLYKAIAETPHLREPYVEMAKLMYEQKDWAGIYHMVMDALKIQDRSTYINEVFCWDYTIYDLGALACYYTGLKEESLEFAQNALNMSPDDERLKSNYEIIKNSI